MGVCTTKQEIMEDQGLAVTMARVQIGHTMVEIIYGHYRTQKAEYLVDILQEDSQQHTNKSDASDRYSQETVNRIFESKKIIQMSSVPKGLTYKKMVSCMMPEYSSIPSYQYKEKFNHLLTEIFSKGKGFVFPFTQTGQFHHLPNQLLVSLILKRLITKQQQPLNVKKIRLVSELQIQKVHGYEWQSESYRSTNYPRMQY